MVHLVPNVYMSCYKQLLPPFFQSPVLKKSFSILFERVIVALTRPFSRSFCFHPLPLFFFVAITITILYLTVVNGFLQFIFLHDRYWEKYG